MSQPPDELAALRNLGPKSAAVLRSAGINTPDELFELGPVKAYQLVSKTAPRSVTVTMLWALAGADLDVDWRQLPQSLKADLTTQVNSGRAASESVRSL